MNYLSQELTQLEVGKTDLKITHLKKRVKRLEKNRKSRAPQLKRRLFKLRIKSSTEKSLGDQEDASNQGRNNQDEGISFVQDAEILGRYGHDTKINTAITSISTVSINITTAEPVTTVSALITTASVSVSTAKPSTPPTTTTTVIEDEDLTIAQTLMKIRIKDRAEGSEIRAKGSSKRAGEELEYDKSKKQKLDEKVEAEEDNDQEEAEMKIYMKIVSDDENIDREDLETLWKLVKAKYGNTRPEEAYKRVLWGDLKVMFEPDIEKKRNRLTPATITDMLNRKLQADH
nr:hypothetical protein [Tanacetum cinerariifolium]